MSQLFGDRTVVANATGCSSIYGGNLPDHPLVVNKQGRGPAWSNSLFEDNAEFGLGMRLTTRQADRVRARAGRTDCATPIGSDLADGAARRRPVRRGRHQRPARAGCHAQGSAAQASNERRRRATCSALADMLVRRERVDHGRRRLGLRHRLRRPRPRAGQRPQRQRAGPRHRGLLQHRRPGVQGHAARRGRQVRRRRQAARPRRTWA